MNDEPTIGHNSVTAAELRSLVERIERLIEEREEIAEQIKEVKAEAKGRGYDRRALDEVLKLRALDRDTRNERETLRQVYAEKLRLFE